MKPHDHRMGVFLASDRVRIFYQSWFAANQKAVVLVSHGLGEHSGRYTNLMNALEGSGISNRLTSPQPHSITGGLFCNTALARQYGKIKRYYK